MIGLESALVISSGVAALAAEREKYLRERELLQDSFVRSSVSWRQQTEAVDADFTELRLDGDSILGEGLDLAGSPRVIVHFKRRPEVVVGRDGDYSVPTWGVRFPFPTGGSFNTLGVMMAQQFVRLYKLATERRLSDDEMDIWLNILDDVDYNGYSDQIRPPLPTKGRRIRAEGQDVIVQMLGGEEERLSGDNALALGRVQDGKWFSVLFKRVRGKIVFFQNVCQDEQLGDEPQRTIRSVDAERRQG